MNKLFLFLLTFVSLCTINAQDNRSNLRAGQAPFFHGVASGDPMSDGVMLWTRVTPDNGSATSIDVYWQMATDPEFTQIVNFGKTEATAAADFTVKLDVCGLEAGTYYYYTFRAYNTNSVIGRTKTAPSGNVSEARFAVASCSSYEHGFFNAYESMAKRNDLDAVIHLGDYIYEYETGGYSSSVVTGFGRTYEPTSEIIALSDYRVRHSHYKLDDQLQRVHQVHPFITTWDDHETANDAYKDGAQNHDSSEGSWIDRKISGTQAYKEWMPIRNPDPLNDVKIWRSLQYGDLLDLIVLDSRLWARDEQDLGATNNNNRDLLGDDQFDWLETELADNSTQWKVICQQVMMAPLELLGFAVNSDQWDGYNKDRNRLINYIESNNIQNPVVLTGDIHTSWINNVPGNATNSAAVEFVVTSVTSPGLDVIEVALGQLPDVILDAFGGAVEGVVQFFNDHMNYINFEDHGYMVLTVDNGKVQGDYVWLEREVIDTTDEMGASWFSNSGASNFQEASTSIAPFSNAVLPPRNAVQDIPFAMLMDTFEINSVENIVENNCLINALSVCPLITTTVLENAEFGDLSLNELCYTYESEPNYYGNDYATITICQTNNLLDCDTVVLSINIEGNNDVDQITYTISSDSIVVDCPIFDDLYTTAETYEIIYTGGNTISEDGAGCFTFEANSNFNGIDIAQFVACDSVGICDTVNLQFIVSGTSTTQIINIAGDAAELLSNCLGFDDFQGNLVSADLEFNNSNGSALIYNDTCISYVSNPDFSGNDTLIFYGCDDFTPVVCDTIIYIMQITTDSVINNISVRDIQNDEYAVMGIYPNPFNEELVVQYYQFKSETISLKMYDLLGRLIYNQQIKDNSTGLKYARLETSSLPAGEYLLEVSTKNFQYIDKVVKY